VGLAEVGRADDAADLVLLTEDPHAKVREAVAAGLGRLLGPEAIGALVPMLADPSMRVRRKALDDFATGSRPCPPVSFRPR
jgi:HEAT repeat protein